MKLFTWKHTSKNSIYWEILG